MAKAKGALHPDSPISQLTGAGPKIASIFQQVGVNTLADLLWYMPFRYDDRSIVSSISDITGKGPWTIRCRVVQARTRKTRYRKSIVEAIVSDDSGSIQCTWFHQPYIAQKLSVGAELFLSGLITYRGSLPVFINPYIDSPQQQHVAGKIVPVYPLHDTLKQHTVRALMRQALTIASQLPSDLPRSIEQHYELSTLSDALHAIHAPKHIQECTRAQERIAVARLVEWTRIMERQQKEKVGVRSPACSIPVAQIKDMLNTLPFQLTPDQKKALWEIEKDMDSTTPMMRMLCGEVGSGKTIVATLASLSAVYSGHQTALMAPTHILAEQHYRSFSETLAPLSLRIVLHTQEHPADAESLRTADIIIGTHALIVDTVQFRSLGLIIIDEQHRFGVEQRHRLLQHGPLTPHFLSLTATPIPRTFALSLFGTLALSTLTTLPPGRKPVRTYIIPEEKRVGLYQFIDTHIQRGEGCFIVCPLIDESEIVQAKSVSETATHVASALPHARIGVLHSKVAHEEQQRIMLAFRQKEIDIIVATTVVEVGVDIPHATIMVIEHGDRFGLATLHQLRGRIGRSTLQSYCFVTTANNSLRAKERLDFFARTRSGFALARYDITHRGAGNLLGTEQSGTSTIIDIALRYPHLVSLAHRIAYSNELRHAPSSSTIHLE